MKNVVRIDINCKNSNNPELIMKFMKFQQEKNIFPSVRGGMSERNEYIAYFSPEDSIKIRKWFSVQKTQKVKKVKYDD